MSLHRQLQELATNQKSIKVGLIGAGKFGSMYLSQIPTTPGVHLVGIADLSPQQVKSNLARVGWKPEQTEAQSIDHAIKTGQTFITEDFATSQSTGPVSSSY